MLGFIKGFFGVGFRPANDIADAAVVRCVTEDANALVSVPWLSSGALDRTGRFAAIAAIAGKAMGVAASGSAFKFYYRRGLTGVWLAEVWSVWKSALIAAPMVVAEMSVSMGRNPTFGFAQFVVGLAITIVFLPRGLMAIGRQFSISKTIGKAGYGPSGLLNLAVGLYGLNAVISSLYKPWAVSGFLGELIGGNVFFASNGWGYYFLSEVPGLFLTMIALSFAFWAVAFTHVGARACAETVFNTMRLGTQQAYNLYAGSAQERATVLKAPQVALGFLAYLVFVIGLINKPLILTVIDLFK